MAKKRVVLTGAGGYVAQRMIRPLEERYDLVCLDVVEKTQGGKTIPNIRIADLANGDRNAYREHFRGADAVLHCAFISARGMGAASWRDRARPFRSQIRDNSDPKFLAEHANIQMAYNVYKTAQEEDVKRVVMTGSNHAADYFEQLIWADKLELVTPDIRMSHNFYGWAKASYELLGFVFASGEVDGKRLEVIQWRIGAPRETDLDEVARLCSVRSGNLASPRAGVYPGAGRSVILVIHESVQTNMENQYAERPG